MTQAPSFGVRLAGLPVRLPAGTPLEYVAQASLHPLPLASKRVAGLMQLRGQPLVVLDASANEGAPARAAAVALVPHDVLVVGTLPNAAALLVDGAPQPVPDQADALALPLVRVGALADCPFFDAIVAHRVAAGAVGHMGETGAADHVGDASGMGVAGGMGDAGRMGYVADASGEAGSANEPARRAGEGASGVAEWYDVDPSRLFAALLAD